MFKSTRLRVLHDGNLMGVQIPMQLMWSGGHKNLMGNVIDFTLHPFSQEILCLELRLTEEVEEGVTVRFQDPRLWQHYDVVASGVWVCVSPKMIHNSPRVGMTQEVKQDEPFFFTSIPEALVALGTYVGNKVGDGGHAPSRMDGIQVIRGQLGANIMAARTLTDADPLQWAQEAVNFNRSDPEATVAKRAAVRRSRAKELLSTIGYQV